MTFGEPHPYSLDWKFSQVFGEQGPGEDVQDIDIISAIEFEKSGDYLAVGDRGGRIVIFEKKTAKDVLRECHSRNELEQLDFVASQHPEFQYKTEFQSHEPEFDYLKSFEIEEKINKVRWCAAPNGSQFILSTNDKTIKLWKVKECKVKKVKEMDLNPFVCSESALLAETSFVSGQHGPSFSNGYYAEWTEKMANSTLLSYEGHTRVYAHAHDFNVNSISNNSDGETFVSADDLRINLWNLEVNDQCFNIIDMRPSNMDDLTEVITSAEFHPFHCNVLAYSSSRGFIRLVDMRQSALCDNNARILQDGDSHGFKSFFTEIIASVSDIKFATDGRHILSRDYMNLKLWDTHMDTSPVATYKIHEHLRPKFCDLYNNDAIFDKFDCCLGGDGLHFATGSYSNLLHIYSYGVGSEKGSIMEVGKNLNRHFPQNYGLVDWGFKGSQSSHENGIIKWPIMWGKESVKNVPIYSFVIDGVGKKPHVQSAPRTRRSSLNNLTRAFHLQGYDNGTGNGEISCSLTSKLLRMAWHPGANLIACAAGSSLFIYHS